MGKAQQWSDSPRLVRMYRFVIKWSVPQQKSNTTHIPPFPFSPSLHLMPLLLDLWLSDSFEKITSHCCFPSASLASPFCPPPPSFFFPPPDLHAKPQGGGWQAGVRWYQAQFYEFNSSLDSVRKQQVRGSGGFRLVLFCSFPPLSLRNNFLCL